MKINDIDQFTFNSLIIDNDEYKLNKFKCRKCNEIIFKKETLQCKRGHWMCNQCWILNKELNKNLKCPYCPTNSIIDSIELSRNMFLESEFGEVMVCCPNSFNKIDKNQVGLLLFKDLENGCKKEFKLNALEEHLKDCECKFEKCKFQGCDKEFRVKELNENHYNQKSKNYCEYSLNYCNHCKRNDIILKELESHYTKCPKMIIECLNCGPSTSPQKRPTKHQKLEISTLSTLNHTHLFPRDKWAEHLKNDCPNQIRNCIFKDGGCKHRFKNSELSSHLSSVDHSQYICELFSKKDLEYQLSLEKSNFLNNKLLDRINYLENIVSYSRLEHKVKCEFNIKKLNSLNYNQSFKIATIYVFDKTLNFSVYKTKDLKYLLFRIKEYKFGIDNNKNNNEIGGGDKNNTLSLPVPLHPSLELIPIPTTSSPLFATPPIEILACYLELVNNNDVKKNITIKDKNSGDCSFLLSSISLNEINFENGWLSLDGKLTIVLSFNFRNLGL